MSSQLPLKAIQVRHWAIGLAGLVMASPLQADPLTACAAIADNQARLACYDALAGRRAARDERSPTAAPTDSREMTGAASAAPAASPAGFGLAPKRAVVPQGPESISGRVNGLGVDGRGHMTVRLEDGAVWELLDGEDPLLARGDQVTIHRAAFDSFIMHTPSHREHRVRRQK